MAEPTKDQIKEALGFIADGKRILGIFDRAESVIVVLGQLNATVESLGKKADGLRAEVAGLEGQKAKFTAEREAHKKTLEAQRVSTLNSIEAEANNRRMQNAQEFAQIGLEHAEKIAEMVNDKKALVQAIADLSSSRDAIILDIASLNESKTTEQSRLDAILAKIAELKNRL